MGIRREQAEQTQGAIIDAAAEAFARDGYPAVTFQTISTRTGISRGGIFHYFENKEVLARKILELEATRWAGLFETATGNGARGLTALAACAHLIASTLHENVRARAALRIAEDLDEVGPTAFDRWDDAVRLALQQAIAEREIPDSIRIADVSAAVVECLYGVCVIPTVARHDRSPSVRVDRALGVLLPGLENG